MRQDVKNRDLSGLCKNIRALPSIKTVHVIKILLRFYFRFWFVQGSFLPSGCYTASSDLTEEQTNSCFGGKQFRTHPNIPIMNHIWLLQLPGSRQRAKERSRTGNERWEYRAEVEVERKQMNGEGSNLRTGCLPNRVNEMINRSRACQSVARGSVTEHEECFFGKRHSPS